MTALLLISIFFLLALASAVYLRSKKTIFKDETERALAPPPRYAGLFADPAREAAEGDGAARERERRDRLAADLRARAEAGERESLLKAHASGVEGLYEEVLSALVARAASSEEELSGLVSFVTRHEQLRGGVPLAEAVLGAWERAPDRASTARALRVAALSDDAQLFGRAVESALRLRREGKLADVRPEDLAALFESEFWLLSSEARSSGAGFVLKRTLADARRELLAPPRPHAARRAGDITQRQTGN